MSTRYDLVGVGIGPFNLSLAALAEQTALRTLFLDDKPWFAWHPGMMIDGARVRMPFLADLVSLADPTSRFSVLNWLCETERLYSFYVDGNPFLERREYEAYCQWVAEQLPSCCFGARVTRVRRMPEADGCSDFEVVIAERPSGTARRTWCSASARCRACPRAAAAPAGGPGSCTARTTSRGPRTCAGRSDVTVVGSGQSGAEVVLDLLRDRGAGTARALADPERGRSSRRSPRSSGSSTSRRTTRAISMDCPPMRARRCCAAQGPLHKAVSAATLAELHAALHAGAQATLVPGIEVTGGPTDGGEIVLRCLHGRLGTEFTVAHRRGRVRHRLPGAPPEPSWPAIATGDADLEHRVAPNLYVQNAERRTHGVGTPELGLGAHRAATILNAVAGRTVHRLPGRAAHTTFDPALAAERDPGIRPAASNPVPHPRPEEPSDADPLPHRPR